MPQLFSRRRIVLLLSVLAIQLCQLHAQQKNFIDQPYLEITGEADTMITPDQIFLSISLSERDTKNRTTTEELEAKMTDALEKLGIDIEKKLTVITVISDYRDYLLKKTEVLKSKRFELEVSTADMATKVLTTLEALDISNIRVSRLDHSRMKEIENEVRLKSVASAQKKAAALVAPLQQKIGKAIHIAEASTPGVPSFNSNAELSEVVVVGYSAKPSANKITPEINFRKITLSKFVNVKFALQ